MRQHDLELKYGINRVDQMLKPNLADSDDLSIPERVIFHYFPVDDVAIGIEPQHPLLKNVNTVIYSENILKLTTDQGTTKYLSSEAGKLNDQYFRRYRQYRKVRDIETVLRGVKSVIIENLALLPHLYRYRKSIYLESYKWANLHNTMMNRIQEIIKKDPEDHDHYVYFELPKRPMRLKTLRSYVDGMTNEKVRSAVKTYRQFNTADLFTWLGEDRFMSRMAETPWSALSKIKLVIYLDGIWTVMGLEELNSFRRSTKEDHDNGYPETKGLSPKEIQLRLLRLFGVLYEKKNIASNTVFEDDTEYEDEVPEIDEGALEDIIEDDSMIEDPDDSFEDEDFTEDNTISKNDGDVSIDLGDFEAPEDRLIRSLDSKAERGEISAAELRRFQKTAVKYKEIESVYGEGTLEDDITFEPEKAKVEAKAYEDTGTVKDKTLLKSTVDNLDEKYTKGLLQKDVAASILSLQNAEVAISDIKREVVEDPVSKYEIYTVKLNPLEGEPTTVKFKLPFVEPDGTFRSNDVRYRLRPQRVDIPIRKVSPERVALTSNYGKIFVDRSQRMTNNYTAWIAKAIMAILVDAENNDITDALAINVFDREIKSPRIFTAIAQSFSTLKIKGAKLFFDLSKKEENYKGVKNANVGLKDIERKGMTFCGIKGEHPIVVDENDSFYIMRSLKDIELIGGIHDLIPSLEPGPTEFAEMKIFNKMIPIGIVLAYAMGLENLLKTLKVDYRRVPRGTRLDLDSEEYAIRFADETLVFARGNSKENLIISGFNHYHNQIKQYSVYDFNKPDVYYSVLEKAGLNVRYVREIRLLYKMFVDQITRRFLVKIKEPTTLRGLLFRSAELLTNDNHPEEINIKSQRLRRYDKFAGIVYEHMVAMMRNHEAKPNRKRSKLELSPFEIWNTIQDDPALGLVQESTPVHNLREKEILTFAGHGGRSKETMVGNTRKFTKDDIGIISESSTDDSNAGITTFLTPNSSIEDVYGFTKPKPDRDPSSVFGSPALLSPFADRDDSKRVMFIGIQQSSATHADGYTVLPVGTGYEHVISQRVDDVFAYHAKEDGKLIENDGKVVVIEYKSGERVSIEIGKRYGKSEGHVIPHELVCTLKPGTRLKKGQSVTRNKHFFEPNPMNKNEVSFRGGALALTTFIESSKTIEDSSAISPRFSELMRSSTTKIKEVVVPFDKIIHNLVKEGSSVDSETVLCMIEERLGENSSFDEKSLETLKKLSRQAPKSGVAGTLERIEVFYFGDKDEMDDSLRKLANKADRDIRSKSEMMGKNIKSAQVDSSLRIDGKPLEMNNMVIRFYITAKLPAGSGDKLVFGSQLKSVIQSYLDPRCRDSLGRPLDAVFGYKSVANRTVNSAELIGQASTICVHLGDEFAAIYRGKK